MLVEQLSHTGLKQVCADTTVYKPYTVVYGLHTTGNTAVSYVGAIFWTAPTVLRFSPVSCRPLQTPRFIFAINRFMAILLCGRVACIPETFLAWQNSAASTSHKRVNATT